MHLVQSEEMRDINAVEGVRARARIFGWANSWRSLQFIDAMEELDFVASDFKSSRNTTLVSALLPHAH